MVAVELSRTMETRGGGVGREVGAGRVAPVSRAARRCSPSSTLS